MKIVASNFAQAHLSLIKSLLLAGDKIPTDYDKPNEPSSLDKAVMIEIFTPWNPPIFSKCVWVNGVKGLLDYKDEVLYGTHDSLVDTLGYTYHERFASQLKGVQDELLRNQHTRRAQFITWQPEKDLGSPYPPCFQRGWFRVRRGKLDFHTHWRSRDALKAWGSNVFAFAHLHKERADKFNLPIGVYREFIDSAHIYGRDIEYANGVVQRPLKDIEWPLEEIMKCLS